MRGTRISLRIIDHTHAPYARPGGQPTIIDVEGRVTGTSHGPEMKDLARALVEIEILVNEQLPHLRLHISVPEGADNGQEK